MDAILKQYEERRSYPRIMLERNALITLESGQKLSVYVHDISKDGMQLRCNRENAAKIHPSGKLLTDETAPEVAVTITLPCSEYQHIFSCKGKLKYLVRLESDIFAIGLYFKEIDENSEKAMQLFIEYAMQPDE